MRAKTELQALTKLSCLFALPFFEFGECVLSGQLSDAERLRENFEDDPVGLEALINHHHLDDLLAPFMASPRLRRRASLRIAEDLAFVWAERLRSILGKRIALVYFGGRLDISVRFHVHRPRHASWAPLEGSFLRRERMRVLRVNQEEIVEISAGGFPD